MTESETESETIDRIEVALRKIAAAAHAPKHPPAPELDKDALKQSLDSLIARLRAGLAPPAAHHVITE
jgi:hypothetical protein